MLEELARELEGRLLVSKFSVTECPRTLGQYGIMAIPTLVILKDGKEVGRVMAAFPKQVLKGKLEAVLWPQNKEGTQ